MNEPTLNPESGFRRLRIDLSYDGTNFSGWAKQPDQRTLQEEIEHALTVLTQSTIATIVAGRTDAGVHAEHQVIHTDVPEKTDITNFAFRLNQLLDEDIRVNSVVYAPSNFHARFTASARTYKYKIIDGGRVTPPLDRYDSADWFRELDIDLMNQGSKLLLGEHDFFAFCKFREGGTTIRNLLQFDWARDEKNYLIATIKAESFRYNMVRNLVGAAVCVGEKRFEPEWMLKTLEDKVRIPDSYVFPAKGLTLVSVEYPAESEYLTRYNNYLESTAAEESES
jgi:tRNA pseudouridine38-40 synthase